MQALLNTAVQAARRAGDIAIRALSRLDQLDIRAKARNDYVTQVDQAAEQAILESIRKRYPDHSFLAEESGHSTGKSGHSEFQWIIDPLDGTTNYVHGFPTFSVSIALRRKETLEVGVVYDPCRQELFTTMRGGGAQLDGKRIRVSERKELEGTLIGTGFPYRSNTRWMKTYLQMLGRVMEHTAGVRRPGSAALDLSYVAAGRLDGFFEFGLEIWDTAAGTLMIQEAGGLVTSLTGKDSHLDSGDVLAGNPKIHDALRALLTPHLNSSAT
ncbi:MAG: inositol monophosphatase [Gammaproteobacteria bacterium]|nr:inositol monophosphatase [Gammaproteobacteria bacterium]